MRALFEKTKISGTSTYFRKYCKYTHPGYCRYLEVHLSSVLTWGVPVLPSKVCRESKNFYINWRCCLPFSIMPFFNLLSILEAYEEMEAEMDGRTSGVVKISAQIFSKTVCPSYGCFLLGLSTKHTQSQLLITHAIHLLLSLVWISGQSA